MILDLKLGAIAAGLSALAVAVPGSARPGDGHHPGHAGGQGNSSGGSSSHGCKAHNVGYVESGTLDPNTVSTLAQSSDGAWSGTLAVDVTHVNHWSRAAKGTIVSYTFSNAKLRVQFDGGTTRFAPRERVHLVGKLAVLASKCTATGSSASPVFRMIVVHPAAS